MFSKNYPAIYHFVEHYGNIEIGENDENGSLIRLTDDEGILYQDVGSKTIDEAVVEAEEFLKDYFFENFEMKIE
jgi:mevalonate kinase